MQTNRDRTVVKMATGIATAGALTLACVLSGCSSGLGSGAFSSTTPAVAVKPGINGSVYGGQQPVSGATIQLFAVGTSGLKSAATSILTTPTTTHSDGTFSVTGDYSCTAPVAATQVYLVATGGNSGASGTNSAIAMMAPLGDCQTVQAAVTAGTFGTVSLNEVTTVAAVYALAPFMSDYSHVGASGASPTGLLNAVANFNNLVNLSAGTAGGASLPAGATVPTTQINTLANLLAICVNTSSPSSGPCTAILGATGASNTIGAALAIAKNPGSSTYTALQSQIVGTPPYQPSLSGPPNDWTIAIKYNAGGTLSAPYGVAIDSVGNAWITNASGSGVTELTPAGAPAATYTGSGLIGPKGIAIDRSGSVWVANPSLNSVVKLTLTNPTTVASGAPFSGIGGLNGPVSLALDSQGNAWIANLTGNSVTELNASGGVVQNALNPSGAISGPTGIALDTGGKVYVANSGGGNVVVLTNGGAASTGSPFTDLALQGTSAVALDAGNNVWATGSTTGTAVAGAVSQFSNAGLAASFSPLGNGGLALPVGVATSGTSAWVTNSQTAGSLSQLVLGQSTPASPSVGLGSLNTPVGVAVDGSGDVWTANSGDNSVSVFIGLTSPVSTPIAVTVGP